MVVLKAVQLPRLAKTITPLAPYVTVSAGLFLFRSAWAALIGYHVVMALILTFSRTKSRSRRLTAGRRWPVSVISGTIGACAGLVLLVAWRFVGLDGNAAQYARSLGLSGATWPAFLAYFIVVNPWIEEFYWRGYLGSSDRRPTFNDGMFSGYHLLVAASLLSPAWLTALFVVLTLAAWFWRQVDRLSDSLLPSIVSHVAADITVMLVAYARIQGT
jgi:hypothetical protein